MYVVFFCYEYTLPLTYVELSIVKLTESSKIGIIFVYRKIGLQINLKNVVNIFYFLFHICCNKRVFLQHLVHDYYQENSSRKLLKYSE